MPERDALILSYSHLREFPREKEALQMLKKVASMVKPLMRARHWVVRELAEFFPDQANLLGLNINKGQRILIRLRYPGDRNQFVPISQVIDTMLHELSHIIHGPHDANFNALWNQLRDELEGLIMKGYTGEGFLSDGHRLGGNGRQVPAHEARRLARAAAEKRNAQNVLSKGSGQRLGGTRPKPGLDIRRTIIKAIDRRSKTLQGCGNENHNDKEIHEIAETATKNGFRTQAEEDAANEAAIAQALWELVQEDEKRKYGASYIPPSAEHPAGNGGWSDVSQQSGTTGIAPPQNGYGSSDRGPPQNGYGSSGRGPPQNGYGSSSWGPPHNGYGSSSWGPPQNGYGSSNPTPPLNGYYAPGPSSASLPAPVTPAPPAVENRPAGLAKGWSCTVCTLHNPREYLCCEVCSTERPEAVSRELASRRSKTAPASSNAASGKPGKRSADPARTAPTGPPALPTWMCSFCGNVMDRQWWTCSACGKMKESSA